jgi:ABC-type transport system involved in multi-copper enzyme maturation permease subunit
LIIGPVFSRELAIAPRRIQTYAARAAYALILLGLISIAWTMLTGTQIVRNLGDMARFGAILFQILAPLQLAMAMFFSATLVAGAVGQEKDRKTLILLLLTHLSNSELVLGKLFASLLGVFMLLVAGLPVFMITAMLGGVSFDQIGRSTAVTAATILACGSLGSTLALWREKTFQSLAMTVLLLVLWLAVWEIVAAGALGSSFGGLACDAWAAMFSPWQAIVEATRPFPEIYPGLGVFGSPVILFVIVALAVSAILNGTAIALVRVWNPSREVHVGVAEESAGHEETKWNLEDSSKKVQLEAAAATTARRSTRAVWDNPILWRETRTWAYGRRILLIRVVYLALFALAAGSLWWMVGHETLTKTSASAVLAPFFFLSLILLNAQAVTALTSERDAKALDLLLVTDLTPKEIVFGKLGGVVYNTKEMFLLPIVLCVYLWLAGMLSLENTFYLVTGLTILNAFGAVLGVHAGITYANSLGATATSLGTVFFLFLGVATCMRMMVAFSGSFEAQLAPFLAITVLGGAGLYLALGIRNPSPAIGLASFLCPFATFYAITSFLLGYTLPVFLVTGSAYGFMIAAMLIPAIYEFDVATGRTTLAEQ